MDPLPMTPSCALDHKDLSLQLERYHRVGRGARQVERTPQRLVVELDEQVDGGLVSEAIAIERECCPFFELDWDPDRRQLRVEVSAEEHAPALEAIAFALAL
jgi:hypothetical protein